MLPLGTTRSIDFRLADASENPVTGRTLVPWSTTPPANVVMIQAFLRNNQACTDTLSLQDYGNGLYTVSYLPTAAGHDLLVLYDQALDIRVMDSEDIMPTDFAIGGGTAGILLNQDYGGTDALRATGLSDDPTTYQLLVFLASDWLGNRRDNANAVGITGLDSNGRWLSGIFVGAGVYIIVVRKPTQTYVIAYSLSVE